MFFLVKEDHCRGFEQDREWDVDGWQADQGLEPYSASNDQWMEIITSRVSLGPPEHVIKKTQMFFMVSYNLDRFRDFVFQSGLTSRFELDPEQLRRMAADDSALLDFGYQWLRFALFGQPSLTPGAKTG